MIYDDDDDGQVDGDASGMVNFQPNTAQPWLRNPLPPWHLWGNTEQFHLETPGGGVAPVESGKQLVKVSYGRPETWKWLFAAKIHRGTQVPPASQFSLIVRFDLTLGVGRASTTITQFENYRFFWGPGFPIQGLGSTFFSTTVHAPNRIQDTAPSEQRENLVSEIVAQDIQIQAVCTLLTDVLPGFVDCEVAAYFSPKSHVRPDWFREGPPELQFPGAEIEGR